MFKDTVIIFIAFTMASAIIVYWQEVKNLASICTRKAKEILKYMGRAIYSAVCFYIEKAVCFYIEKLEGTIMVWILAAMLVLACSIMVWAIAMISVLSLVC